MSAIIVLILRFMMILFLYAFLITALYVMWKRLTTSAKSTIIDKTPIIRIGIEIPQQSLAFNQSEILIGRDEQNDIQLNNETVSGIHARILYRNNQWLIEDLDSTNGTFINNERITTATVLVSQDVITCGSQNFSITFEN